MEKLLIDHILIAVSEDEFQRYIDFSKSNNKFKYKKTVTEKWKWEGIYLGLIDNLYLEIVREDSYPCRIGMAISLLGEENHLLSKLQSKYTTWEFEQENAKKDGSDWYKAYFSSYMESKHAFLWFMEYQGKFRESRKYLTSTELPEIGENVTISLNYEEFDNFTNQASLCDLFIEEEKDRIKIFDFRNRGFYIKKTNSPSTRINLIEK